MIDIVIGNSGPVSEIKSTKLLYELESFLVNSTWFQQNSEVLNNNGDK